VFHSLDRLGRRVGRLYRSPFGSSGRKRGAGWYLPRLATARTTLIMFTSPAGGGAWRNEGHGG